MYMHKIEKEEIKKEDIKKEEKIEEKMGKKMEKNSNLFECLM